MRAHLNEPPAASAWIIHNTENIVKQDYPTQGMSKLRPRVEGGLNLPAPFERLAHRHRVGIVEVSAHGQPHRQARHLDAERVDEP